MISEENEKLAEAAHNIWLESHPNDPTWVDFRPKHIYRDLVETYQRKPHNKLIPNELEQCVVDAIARDKEQNAAK